MEKKIRILGEGRYAVSEHQQSVDRKGQLVRVIKESPTKPIPVGEAYAFFDCDASMYEIEEEAMPDIRRDAQTPKGLELVLSEGVSGLNLDKKLREAIQYPDDYRILSESRKEEMTKREAIPAANLRYALVARLPNSDNLKTARELRDITNYISFLNEDSSLFRCAVVYAEKDGEYRLLED